MLYSIIRGVIDNNNISKEHKMHFTTGSVHYIFHFFKLDNAFTHPPSLLPASFCHTFLIKEPLNGILPTKSTDDLFVARISSVFLRSVPLIDSHRGCSMLCAVAWGAIQGSVAKHQRAWALIYYDWKHTHMQTNPYRADETTFSFTYCTWLLVYDYLLYITYVTCTFATK